MNDKELNTAVNPTSNTAITTLIMLANAGYEKASEILGCMGIEKETFPETSGIMGLKNHAL